MLPRGNDADDGHSVPDSAHEMCRQDLWSRVGAWYENGFCDRAVNSYFPPPVVAPHAMKRAVKILCLPHAAKSSDTL